MDAVKFLKELRRLCEGRKCGDCPLYTNGCSCIGFKDTYPEDLVAIVERWSREHPIKTNAEKFKEVFGMDPDDSALWAWASLSEWWNSAYKESI